MSKTKGFSYFNEFSLAIQPNGGNGKVRMDHVSTVNGEIKLRDSKSSATAGFTTNQKSGYPLLEQNGGVVKGNNGAAQGYPDGTVIKPTKVDILRPKPGQPIIY